MYVRYPSYRLFLIKKKLEIKIFSFISFRAESGFEPRNFLLRLSKAWSVPLTGSWRSAGRGRVGLSARRHHTFFPEFPVDKSGVYIVHFDYSSPPLPLWYIFPMATKVWRAGRRVYNPKKTLLSVLLPRFQAIFSFLFPLPGYKFFIFLDLCYFLTSDSSIKISCF